MEVGLLCEATLLKSTTHLVQLIRLHPPPSHPPHYSCSTPCPPQKGWPRLPYPSPCFVAPRAPPPTSRSSPPFLPPMLTPPPQSCSPQLGPLSERISPSVLSHCCLCQCGFALVLQYLQCLSYRLLRCAVMWCVHRLLLCPAPADFFLSRLPCAVEGLYGMSL